VVTYLRYTALSIDILWGTYFFGTIVVCTCAATISDVKLFEQIGPDGAAAEICTSERQSKFAPSRPVGVAFEQFSGCYTFYRCDILKVRVDALYFLCAFTRLNFLFYLLLLGLFNKHLLHVRIKDTRVNLFCSSGRVLSRTETAPPHSGNPVIFNPYACTLVNIKYN